MHKIDWSDLPFSPLPTTRSGSLSFYDGIDIRTWAAVNMMAAIVNGDESKGEGSWGNIEEVAAYAVRCADAVLRELEK